MERSNCSKPIDLIGRRSRHKPYLHQDRSGPNQDLNTLTGRISTNGGGRVYPNNEPPYIHTYIHIYMYVCMYVWLGSF